MSNNEGNIQKSARWHRPAIIAIVVMIIATAGFVFYVANFSNYDRTYGSLGTAVTEAGLAAAGPMRERYLVSPSESADPLDWRTEVCWPIAT